MHPKRHSQIEKAVSVLDRATPVGVFKHDKYLLFIFKKSERIASAVYILTGLLSDTEPLRNQLREVSIALVRRTLTFKEKSVSHTDGFINDMSVIITELTSLFEVAHIADLISPMNFSVMRKELETLLSIVEVGGRGRDVHSAIFNDDFFGISRDVFAPQGSSRRDEDGTSTHTVSSVSSKVGSASDLEKVHRDQILKDNHKGHITGGEQSVRSSTPSALASERSISRDKGQRHTAVPNVVKEEREAKIVLFLRQNKVAMIKDFTSMIQGCSEKTIQRALSGLVDKGVLKKEGERRWSRYSLVDPRL